jgi:squalene-hopene/tetraprenyl-beta-curcumene cyclase
MIRAALLLLALAWAAAAEAPARVQVDVLIARAQGWLVAQARPDGALVPGRVFPLGITAFAAGVLAEPPAALPATHPTMAAAIAYLVARKQPDGGVYDPEEGLGVYGTSLALLLAARLPEGARGGLDVPAMQSYLFAQQNGEAGSPGQGGIGYGDKGRGSEDLSNTGYALQALRASGVPAQDAHMQAALAFLQRCQDLSAVNPAPWAKNSGGGVYGPQEAARSWESGDESQSPRWTPSGTMTYELISSYLLLDLAHDDPRVQAAVAWLGRNYGFAANPGMGPGRERQGLYHLHALAGTALGRAGAPTIPLPGGGSADWRADLFAVVAAEAQRAPLPGGGEGAFWINSAQRWGEGLPHLSTAYALRALKAIARTLP